MASVDLVPERADGFWRGPDLRQASETVEQGDLIVVLEAMRMERDVTAPTAGSISDLAATPGDTVS